MKKLKVFLQLFDGIWSIPLSFIVFWFTGLVLTAIFGYNVGTYDIGFIQPLFLAIAVCIGAANAALGFMYFFARGLFKWFYGYRKKFECTGRVKFFNPSKTDWRSLQPMQKFLLFFLSFFLMMAAIIFVYTKFI